MAHVINMGEASLVQAVSSSRLSQQQADRYNRELQDILYRISPRSMARLRHNLGGFNWYATGDELNAAYQRLPGAQNMRVGGFFDPNDGTVHLADYGPMTYAHELAHAIDGEHHVVSDSPEWRRAYNAEKGRLSSRAYPTSNRQEWWCALAEIMLADPGSGTWYSGGCPAVPQF